MISNPTDKNAQLTQIASLYAAGILEVWSGTTPAIDVVPTGTKLVSITLPNPSFGAPSNGQMNKTGTWKTNAALATGTPSFYRFIATGGSRRQGSAAMNTGAELICSDPDDPTATQILANRAVEVIAYTMVQA